MQPQKNPSLHLPQIPNLNFHKFLTSKFHKVLTSIFWPRIEGLKFDLRTTLTSILVRPTSRTNGMHRNGKLISLVVRYFINSNSPSGGMKLMLRSDSNLLSLITQVTQLTILC